jgi:hypothetical protein
LQSTQSKFQWLSEGDFRGHLFAPSGDLGVPQTGTNTRETSENHYTTLAWEIPEPEGAKHENKS